jgi:inner membrane protein
MTKSKGKPLTQAPLRWGALYGMALVALLSHLLLDYTNNYGLRPFYPFSNHWYAASIVFIFDPAIFGLLLIALVAPALFGLIGSEVGARRQVFKGRGWAIVALLGVVCLWSLRAVEHGKAVDLAMQQSIADPNTPPSEGVASPYGQHQSGSETLSPESKTNFLQPVRALASPDLINPFHWSTATDFGPLYQLAEVDTRYGALTPDLPTFPKPSRDAEVLIAERTRLGRAYFDWSPMPIVDVSKPDPAFAAATGGDPDDDDHLAVVTFRDPRFMGGWMRDLGRSALTGTVLIDAAGHVVRQGMDGRVER